MSAQPRVFSAKAVIAERAAAAQESIRRAEALLSALRADIDEESDLAEGILRAMSRSWHADVHLQALERLHEGEGAPTQEWRASMQSLRYELNDLMKLVDLLLPKAKRKERLGKSDEYSEHDLRNVRDKTLELLRGIDTRRTSAQSWRTLAHAERGSMTAVGETLAYATNVLVRRAGLDAGFLQIGQGFLHELEPLGREPVPTLADADYYRTGGNLLRMQFAGLGLWTLPIIAHEWAHWVEAGNSKLGDAVREYLSEPTYGWNQWQLEELLADVWASLKTGPAYGFAIVLLRFDPESAKEGSVRHPSAAQRVRAILAALYRAGPKDRSVYNELVDTLRATWQGMCRAAGSTAALPQSEAKELDRQVNRQIELLDRWSIGSLDVERWFPEVPDLATSLNDENLTLPDPSSLRAVLNAIWLSASRSDGSARLDPRIEARGLELCKNRLEQLRARSISAVPVVR